MRPPSSGYGDVVQGPRVARAVTAAGVALYVTVSAWSTRHLWFWWDEISYLRAQRIPRYELQGFLGNWLPGGRVAFRALQEAFGNAYWAYVGVNALLASGVAWLIADAFGQLIARPLHRAMLVVALLSSTSFLANVVYASEAGRWISIGVVLAGLAIARRHRMILLPAVAVAVSSVMWLSSAIPMALVVCVLVPHAWSRRDRLGAGASAIAVAAATTVIGRAIAVRYVPTQETSLIGEAPSVEALSSDAVDVLVRSAASWWSQLIAPVVPGLWTEEAWMRAVFNQLLDQGYVAAAFATITLIVLGWWPGLLRRAAAAGVALFVVCLGIVARGWEWLNTGPELKYGNVTNILAIACWLRVWEWLRASSGPTPRLAARALGALGACVVAANVLALPRTLDRLTGEDWHVGSAEQKQELTRCATEPGDVRVVYPGQTAVELCEIYLALED